MLIASFQILSFFKQKDRWADTYSVISYRWVSFLKIISIKLPIPLLQDLEFRYEKPDENECKTQYKKRKRHPWRNVFFSKVEDD